MQSIHAVVHIHAFIRKKRFWLQGGLIPQATLIAICVTLARQNGSLGLNKPECVTGVSLGPTTLSPMQVPIADQLMQSWHPYLWQEFKDLGAIS